MKLFSRLRDGFFNPILVNNYKEDKKIYTAFFYFFLVFLMIIPQGIYYLASPIFSYEDKAIVKEMFYHSDEVIPFRITNNILFHKEHDSEYKYVKTISEELTIVFRSTYDLDEYDTFGTVIEFARTGVYLHTYGYSRVLFGYNEYPQLKNLDFEAAYNADKEFWNIVYSVVDEEINKVEPLIRIKNVGFSFLAEAIVLFFLSLLLSFFNKPMNRRDLSFSKMWQMVIYLMTPFAIFSLLSDMFGLSLLYYIGLIYTMLNIMRFSQIIAISIGGHNNEL